MDVAGAFALWGHSLAALLFGALALWTLRLTAKRMPRIPFAIALIATALWALSVAGIGPQEPGTLIARGLRDLAWLSVLLLLHRTLNPQGGFATVGSVYGVVALVVVATMALHLAAGVSGGGAVTDAIDQAALILGMMTTIAGLWLVQGLLAGNGRRTRWAIALAPAALWSIDLAILAAAYLTDQSPDWTIAVRGTAMAGVAMVVAIGLHRADQWNIQVSRLVALQSLSFVAAGLYFVAVAAVTGMLAGLGGEQARIFQTAFVFGSTATALAALSSPHLRGWAKVKLAKHFYRHRYDYRAEWIRFTDTLGGGQGDGLDRRLIKAIADLTESPGGLLLVPEGAGLGIGTEWRWQGAVDHAAPADERLVAHLARTGRIIELDAVRGNRADAIDAQAIPEWMVAMPDAWVIVPLPHQGRLTGAILLARPAIDRSLDWEDFDLLKIAGRQVGSHLAEARAQEALMEAQRFEEFNRRFAFIMHDIKNLVSQLTLVARNAERHAENPAFRADMVATLKESAGRMNALLAKLSQHHHGRSEPPEPVSVRLLVEKVAASRRGQHPVQVTGDADATAIANPARIEQVVGHLLQNAIDASPAHEAVTIRVGDDGATVTIDVVDRGCGMAPAFVRDRLFKPFDSTKPGGFGIGAFEARQLAESMRGTLEVTSREAEGTRFRLTLPRATTSAMDAAA